MATFRITPQTSVLQTGANLHAFDGGTAGADRLIVDKGAFLIATGGGAGAFLENSGAWNVTINGSVAGTFFLDLNNTATSTVKVGKTGSIGTVFLASDANFNNAGTVAAFITANSKYITNSGSIDSIFIGTANGTVLRNSGDIGAGLGGISLQVQGAAISTGISIINSGNIAGSLGATIGNDTLRNSGTIGDLQSNSSMFFFDGANSVVNTGTVFSGYIGGNDRDSFVNYKDWNGSVGLANGANTFVNRGFVGDGVFVAQILGGNDADRFINSGTIRAFVFMGDGSNTLSNSGVIGALGISGGNDKDVVSNRGTINGDVVLQDGDNRFVNSGSLTRIDLAPNGGSYLGGKNKDDVVNSGTIAEVVALGDGTNTLRNGGTIAGFVQGGVDSDTITNLRVIGGAVALFDGANTLTNSGKIGTDTATKKSYIGGANTDFVTNKGTIASTVDLGDGDNTFVNSGLVDGTDTFVALPLLGNQFVDGDVLAGSGNDTMTNTGTIHGAIVLGDGINTLTNSGTITGTLTLGGVKGGVSSDTVTNTGKILSVVDLQAGDDSYTGSKFVDIVTDGDGADIVNLGAGNDLYGATGNFGVDGVDTIDGGIGRDAYGFAAATNGVKVNLDTIAHNGIAANRASGTDVSAAAFDIVLNFEDVDGGGGSDEIHGTKSANLLKGGGGDDKLFGYGGADTLTGDAGADTFFFTSAKDSTTSARDIITDYISGTDRIDLSAIDANVANGAVNDAFSFIGTNAIFGGIAGQLRAIFSGNDQVVEGDINGDGRADFAILLANTVSATITNADFIL